jgi:dolichol-phosphate mannosyltransferase
MVGRGIKMTVSAILPTYQEATTAPNVVATLQEYGVGEVVVVDDSPTRATAEAILAEAPETTIVRRSGDGLASAVVAGFEVAAGDTYVVLDADGQHPPERVPALVEAIDAGADLAVGSRHRADTPITDGWSWSRYLTSFGGAVLAWAALPPARRHLQDPMSGFFAVRASVVDPAVERDALRPRGFKILLELLAKCPIRRIAEVPTAFRERAGGESNLDAREYLRFLRHTLAVAYAYRRRPTIEHVRTEVATDGGS